MYHNNALTHTNMTKQEIFKAAHKMAKEAINGIENTWMVRQSNGTYKGVFANALRRAHENNAKQNQPVKSWSIKTPYGDRNCYSRCKKLNGIWNGKYWEITCKKHELGILEEYIVKANTSSTYNTGLGFYGSAADARRGFDGIE